MCIRDSPGDVPHSQADPSGLEALMGPREAIDLAEGLGRTCLLYTSDAADERSSVDLGGSRIIKKKK
mgnify:CR=1 FL=1